MTRRAFPVIVTVVLLLAAVGGIALAALDKYPPVRVASRSPSSGDTNAWQTISVSQTGDLFAVILANPEIIEGLPGRCSRQRQAFPGWLQDGEDPLEPEKECGSPRSRIGAGHPA